MGIIGSQCGPYLLAAGTSSKTNVGSGAPAVAALGGASVWLPRT